MNSQFESREVSALFSSEQQIVHMLAFERALAVAQGRLTLIPAAAATAIADVCADRHTVARISLARAAIAGNPAIPFVEQLREIVNGVDPAAGRWIHHGATSQDAIDTATMLALRETFILVERDLNQLRDTVAARAREHAGTAMIGRTLLQQAIPTTLGCKLAAILAGLDATAARIRGVLREKFPLQLGGPVGTLSVAGAQAAELTRSVATSLDLAAPPIAWHTNRFVVADCASILAIVTGLLGKLATDIVHLMQSEIGEVAESRTPGKGGSSSMPHKHNPVDAVAVNAAAMLTSQLTASLFASMSQEHERAAGAWHAEWISLPALCSLTHGALLASGRMFAGLQVDAEAMSRHLAAGTAAARTEAAVVERDVRAAQARTLEYLDHRGANE